MSRLEIIAVPFSWPGGAGVGHPNLSGDPNLCKDGRGRTRPQRTFFRYDAGVTPFRSVLCAVDLSDHARAVLYHATGIAGASGARLSLVYVGGADGRDIERQLHALYFETVPYGAPYVADPHVEAREGRPADAILQSARECGADLIVTGTRARGPLARLLLGSTTATLLQDTDRPVLLVPPSGLEVLSLTPDRVVLHFGAVVAAVDLAERSDAQLRLAAALAGLARQPLMLLCVRQGDADDHEVAAALRARAREAEVTAKAVIVRQGQVAEEIARAARHEQAGLVVLGLRKVSRGTPGAIAGAVLESGRTLVLAVPER
jgi:nucleotide-binding universal stress UspA family protein